MRRTLAFLLLLSVLAGCIDVPDGGSGDDVSGASSPPADRIEGMTATERRDDVIARCQDDGITVPPGPYCGQRTVTVTGRIGLDRLPVSLLGTNGAVVLTSGEGDAWSFVAIVKTRALTEEEARRGLDTAWSWSHEDAQGHHLKAGPVGGVPLLGATLVGVQYEVSLPEWVALDLAVETTNGAVSLGWGRAEAVSVRTTNGAVMLGGRAVDVDVSTTNGAITATLVPARSGEWAARTTNGAIHLVAPEHRERGYDLDARSTNGRVDILLQDGRTEEMERSHKTFRTDGFASRAVQTRVALGTTNGAITVAG